MKTDITEKIKVSIIVLCILFFALITITTMINTEEVEEPTVIEAEVVESVKYGTIEYIEEVSMKDWQTSARFSPVDCELETDVQEFVYYLCYGYNIDFCFAMAVIETESGYMPNLVSTTNDYGLMQINKCNHEWMSETFGVTDYLDPYQNVTAGVAELHRLFQKYDGEPSMVLMAYNMGERGASKLWNKGIYESNYSKKILERAAELQEEYE